MCPATTAPPGSPGRGLAAYQPATAGLAGGGTAAHLPLGIGTSAVRPTGVAARPVWLAAASPAAPAPASSSPTITATAATGRRTTRMDEMCWPRRPVE